MSGKKRQAHEEHGGNHERWLLTYADMITLLMIFFIIMYSMSIVDAKKFSSLAESLSGVLNNGTAVTNGSAGILPDGAPKVEYQNTEAAKLEKTVAEVQQLIKSNNLSAEISIVQSESALTIRLKENLLFDSGSASVRSTAFPTLDSISKMLSELDNNVRVEGYTDDVPIRSSIFKSNWELASQRAINVLNYLAHRGVNESRLSAESFGQFRPLVPNSSKENRQKNRRVDIVIIKSTK